MKCQHCIKMSKLHEQQAEQIRQLEDMLMFRIEDISRLKSELLTRPPLPLEGEARSRILQEMGATGIDDAIRKYKQQAEQIEQLKELLSLCQPDVSNVMDTRIREALAAQPQKGE